MVQVHCWKIYNSAGQDILCCYGPWSLFKCPQNPATWLHPQTVKDSPYHYQEVWFWKNSSGDILSTTTGPFYFTASFLHVHRHFVRHFPYNVLVSYRHYIEMVEWWSLTVLRRKDQAGWCGNTCIWEVLGLNLGWEPCYSGWGFPWFSSVCLGKCLDSMSIRLQPLHSKPFSNSYTCDPTSQHYIVWDNDNTVK
jgi:hypothetical protein